MVERGNKEDLEKKEERLKKEKEKEEQLSLAITKLDNQYKANKGKRDNVLDNYLKVISPTLDIWNNKIKNESISESLYILTASLIDFATKEKDFNFIDSLNQNEKVNLLKFFYTTYERITNKKNCCGLKPSRIYTLHQTTISSQGVGNIHRALFSIRK